MVQDAALPLVSRVPCRAFARLGRATGEVARCSGAVQTVHTFRGCGSCTGRLCQRFGGSQPFPGEAGSASCIPGGAVGWVLRSDWGCWRFNVKVWLLRALGSFSLSRATLALGTTVRAKRRRLAVEVPPAALSGAGGLRSHVPVTRLLAAAGIRLKLVARLWGRVGEDVVVGSGISGPLA